MCYSNGVINLDKHCDSEGGKIRLIPGPPGPKGYSADLSTVLLMEVKKWVVSHIPGSEITNN